MGGGAIRTSRTHPLHPLSTILHLYTAKTERPPIYIFYILYTVK